MYKAPAHYYSKQPQADSRRFTITYELRGAYELTFTSDSGVFSKRRVDFGTDLLIRSIPPISGRALDLGCGYGAAGIALSLLNPGVDMWFADINERAVELCRENYTRLIANPTPKQPTPNQPIPNIVCSDGFDALGDSLFDTVFFNPPIRTGKANVYRLYGEVFSHLANNGAFYLVIQKKQGMESTFSELERLFGNCADIARKAGYHILVSKKIPNA